MLSHRAEHSASCFLCCCWGYLPVYEVLQAEHSCREPPGTACAASGCGCGYVVDPCQVGQAQQLSAFTGAQQTSELLIVCKMHQLKQLQECGSGSGHTTWGRCSCGVPVVGLSGAQTQISAWISPYTTFDRSTERAGASLKTCSRAVVF